MIIFNSTIITALYVRFFIFNDVEDFFVAVVDEQLC